MKRNKCRNILKFVLGSYAGWAYSLSCYCTSMGYHTAASIVMATVCIVVFMFIAMCDLDSNNGDIGDCGDRAQKSISWYNILRL